MHQDIKKEWKEELHEFKNNMIFYINVLSSLHYFTCEMKHTTSLWQHGYIFSYKAKLYQTEIVTPSTGTI